MRPTDYKPEYCQIATDYIAEGHSMESLAWKIGVIRQTIYNWKETYKEFSDAIDAGFAGRQAMVEDLVRENAKTGIGGSAATIFMAKNWAGMRDMTPGDKDNPFHFDREVEPEQLARFVARHGENKAE